MQGAIRITMLFKSPFFIKIASRDQFLRFWGPDPNIYTPIYSLYIPHDFTQNFWPTGVAWLGLVWLKCLHLYCQGMDLYCQGMDNANKCLHLYSQGII